MKPHMNEGAEREQMVRRALDAGWTLDDLRDAARINQRVQEDPALGNELADMDQLRAALRPGTDSHAAEEAPSGGFLALRQRLREEVEHAAAVRTPHGIVYRMMPGVVGGLLAAVVCWLALNLGFGGWLNHQPRQDAPVQAVKTPTQDPRYWLPEAPAEQRAAFDQLAAFFDGRTGWMATTAGDTEIGLENTPVPDQEPVLMRLSLEQPNGQIIRTDLAVLPGQEVDLKAPLADGREVRYRLSVRPGVFGASSPTAARGSVRLAAYVGQDNTIATELPLDGAPVRPVGRLMTSEGDYLVRLGVIPGSLPSSSPSGGEKY